MWTLTLDTKSLTPIYLQIIDQIRAGVRAAELVSGAPLPAVRQLASDLEINPNTVAKAYLLLEREGIVRSVPRRGCFVAETARRLARQSADERLGLALDQILDETARLGLDQEDLLRSLRLKLENRKLRQDSKGGEIQ